MSLDDELRAGLDRRRERGLLRATELDGRVPGHDFGGNDYLGLARDPEIAAAAAAAAQEFGAGGRAARLLSGGSPLHERCERDLADWLSCDAALLFPSGYQANVGLVAALVGRGDAVISDRDNHASWIDAMRMSRARVLVHEHLDLAGIEAALRQAAGCRRRLVVTEGVFSMAGDAAPLAQIEALCREHDAWLVVDEAHSAGMLGPAGAGAAAAEGLVDAGRDPHSRLCARVVTGGKALGVAGALVAGSATLRAHLIHAARSFVFTTAPQPSLAGALVAAIARCRAADERRARALANARRLAQQLDLPPPAAAIVPVPIGDSARAAQLAADLRAAGFYAPAVRPPTVSPAAAGLRLVCHADHDEAQIDALAAAVRAGSTGATSAEQRSVAPRRPLCVVGTDTGIGKTVVSALLLRAAQSCDRSFAYWKPVQTGDREDDDTRTVQSLAAVGDDRILPRRYSYALPASPHEAAADVGERVSFDELRRALAEHRDAAPERRVLVEFAGGLLVPLDLDPPVTQADWLARMQAQVVLVARSGLGTLNHTLLTLEALRARRVEPAALFVVGAPHASNLATLRRLAGVRHVFEVPPFEPLDTSALDEWTARHGRAVQEVLHDR